MPEGRTMAYADALRGYLSHLREQRGIPQWQLAEAMGIARNTYISWETGETRDLKVPRLIRALRFFGVPLDYLEKLGEAETEEEGRKLADDWLKMTPDQQAQAARIQTKFQRIIELGEQDPAKLEQVIERLRADAQTDPALLDLVLVWLDGRRSR